MFSDVSYFLYNIGSHLAPIHQMCAQNIFLDRTGSIHFEVFRAGRGHIAVGGSRPSRSQSTNHVADRQAHHTGITAFDTFNRPKFRVLNGISAGFIKRIATGNITLYFRILVIAHPDSRNTQVGNQMSRLWISGADGGIDAVLAPAQVTQHLAGLSGVCRFSQDTAAIRDGSIRRQEQFPG